MTVPVMAYRGLVDALPDEAKAEAKSLGYLMTDAKWAAVPGPKRAQIMRWLRRRLPSTKEKLAKRRANDIEAGTERTRVHDRPNLPKPAQGMIRELARLEHLPRSEAMRSLTASFAELGQLSPDELLSSKANTVFQAIAQGNLARAITGDPHNTKLVADFVGESPKVKAELLLSDAEGNSVSGMEIVFRAVPTSGSIIPPDASHRSYTPRPRPDAK